MAIIKKITDIGKGVKKLVLVYILDNLVSSQKKKKNPNMKCHMIQDIIPPNL